MQSNALFSVRIQHSQNCCVKQNHLPVCPNFSIQWLQDYFHNDSFSFFFSQLELNTFEAPILCMWVLCCLPCFSVPGPCAPVPPGASQQSAPYAALRCSYYQSRINERQKTNPAMDDWVQHELQAANTQPKQFTIGKQSDMQKKGRYLVDSCCDGSYLIVLKGPGSSVYAALWNRNGLLRTEWWQPLHHPDCFESSSQGKQMHSHAIQICSRLIHSIWLCLLNASVVHSTAISKLPDEHQRQVHNLATTK